MATGKTHGRYVKVLVDDSGGSARDISAAVNNIGGVGVSYDQVDVTGLSDTLKQFVSGWGDATLTLGGPFSNTATTGAHTVLSGIVGTGTAGTVTIQIGIRGAATTGDPEFEGEFVCTDYVVNVAPEATWTATFKPGYGASTPAWGTV